LNILSKTALQASSLQTKGRKSNSLLFNLPINSSNVNLLKESQRFFTKPSFAKSANIQYKNWQFTNFLNQTFPLKAF
jgi:hypothetical protein